jgi:uncharacterized protein (TIGR04255 family)
LPEGHPWYSRSEKKWNADETDRCANADAIDALCNAYSEDLKFSSFSLRYIDVVRTKDYVFSNWPDFVKNHINFSFENQYDTRGKLKNFSFDQVFELPGGGSLQIIFSNGSSSDDEDLFVFQIAVNETFNVQKKELMEKIKAAHLHTSAVFKDICKKKFYASFS